MSTSKVPAVFCAFAWSMLAAFPAAGQATKINVGYTTAADFVPTFVAKEKGFFEKRNLDVTLTRIALASNVPSALISGSLQVGMGTPPILLQAADGGLGLVAICGVSRFEKSNPMSGLVARQGVKIANAGDLRGKKVGVPGLNSFFDIMFRKWLLNNKVPLNQVTFVEAPFPQMKDLLKGGQLDAVEVIEPFRTRIVGDGTGQQVADFVSEVSGDVLGAFWMATTEWAAKNAQAIGAFREAYKEGIAYAVKNPVEAKKLEAKYLGVAGPVVPSYSAEFKPGDLEFYAGIAKELGMLRNPVDVGKLILK